MTPSWRKPVGALMIIALIAIWAGVVASLSGTVGGWPILAQTLFYLVTGVVWILPLGPLLKWIETGRWR
ncbi:MAG: DUF2842 domain-containing protein [Sphingomonas sp.]|uniref:DUF2842 domain-containing protein n=1 Tax=Sphingomonas sp. TaxID=28214 RepID=UPI0025FE6201|nr:DUF2842 domain-containing protein [Sphingomonas sp.]MBX9859967.1 DUF2842 domain-containing protein [Sphingomonas sp.]MBY0283994.1 DUF2842 domain-containing protein [Sphingomonas sp.]